MSKEYVFAQLALESEGRERLQVENIRDLGRFAFLTHNGASIPPDLKPLEQHLINCELCRNDVIDLRETLDFELKARADNIFTDEISCAERQAQEGWMWENR